MGANPVPETRAEAEALVQRFRPELVSDARTVEVSRIILNQPVRSLRAAPVQQIMMQAAVDLLPAWAREQHQLRGAGFAKPAIRGPTFALASSLRWAFAGESRK